MSVLIGSARINERGGINGGAAGDQTGGEVSGSVHYTSSYASGKSRACKGGKAKVTQISKGKPHPYHLVSAEKGCTVYGWVDADKVSK